MPRLMTLTILALTTSTLTGCGRDAPSATPDDMPEAAEPQPPEAEQPSDVPVEPQFEGACGIQTPEVEFEILDAPAAGEVADVRLRWPADAPMPAWECCPYQHLPSPFVDGGVLLAASEGSDNMGRFIDAQIAVDDTPGADLMIGLGFCQAQQTQTWTIAPSPLAEAHAALAACEPVEDEVSVRNLDDADLRVTAFAIQGVVAPGATIELDVALAEVAGVGHGYYPGFMFDFDPPVVDLSPNAGIFYATFACEETAMTIPVALPDDLEPRTILTVTTHVGEPLCRDGDCSVNDSVSLSRRVFVAP